MGLEVAAYAEDMIRVHNNSMSIKGFLDDTKTQGSRHAGYPILGKISEPVNTECLYVIAIAAPQVRKTTAEKLQAAGAKFATIIHPTCYIAASAKLGTGVILAPFTFVGPEAELGNHCFLNVYASFGHESRLGDYSVLSPYATVNGASIVGSCVFMGSHATVTAKTEVGHNVKIAAGAVTYNTVPDDAHVMGNPAAWRV